MSTFFFSQHSIFFPVVDDILFSVCFIIYFIVLFQMLFFVFVIAYKSLRNLARTPPHREPVKSGVVLVQVPVGNVSLLSPPWLFFQFVPFLQPIELPGSFLRRGIHELSHSCVFETHFPSLYFMDNLTRHRSLGEHLFPVII